MIEEIKLDLGADINSLGISDETISLKIAESLRKISSYAPYREVASFSVSNKQVVMPRETVTVVSVYNLSSLNNKGTTLYQNDTDLFSVSRYLYNYNDLSDPFIFLMQKNQLNTLQNFINISDWRYEKHNNTLYINNFSGNSVSVLYLRKYKDLAEIKEDDIIQAVKEYALALCKIIEGTIRRKLQGAPGAIQMDGDALVSEGTSEKQRLDDWIPKTFAYLRMGIRV